MNKTLNKCHHFSDGGGRSGVYLGVDANLELMEEEDGFDVFGYLKKLRQSRKGLIETMVYTSKLSTRELHYSKCNFLHRSNTNSCTTPWRSLWCAATRGFQCPSCPSGFAPSH
jgi:hypothetical protein